MELNYMNFYGPRIAITLSINHSFWRGNFLQDNPGVRLQYKLDMFELLTHNNVKGVGTQ